METAKLQQVKIIGEDAVLAQLARMEQSALFANSPRLTQLLRYLVVHSLAGNGRELLEYAVGVEVFRRGESFDPQRDTIVRATARRLRRQLMDYYAAEGISDPVRFELPKGHYRVEFHPGMAEATAPERRSLPPFPRLWLALFIAVPLLILGIGSWRQGLSNVSVPTNTEVDLQARQHLAIGQHLFHRRGHEDVQIALTEFERAAAIDPELVDAWVGMAGCLKILGTDGAMPRAESLARQRAALTSALALVPENPEANQRMADVLNILGEEESSRQHLARAVEAGQNSVLVQGSAAGRARMRGDIELAVELQGRAVALDPLSASSHFNLAGMLLEAGRFDQAVASYRQARTLSPALGKDVDVEVVRALLLAGRLREAEAALATLGDGDDLHQAQALLHIAQGRDRAAISSLRALASSGSLRALQLRAEVYAYRGDHKMALEQIEFTYGKIVARYADPAQSARAAVELHNSPFFRELHSDKRWIAWSDHVHQTIRGVAPELEGIAATTIEARVR